MSSSAAAGTSSAVQPVDAAVHTGEAPQPTLAANVAAQMSTLDVVQNSAAFLADDVCRLMFGDEEIGNQAGSTKLRQQIRAYLM